MNEKKIMQKKNFDQLHRSRRPQMKPVPNQQSFL